MKHTKLLPLLALCLVLTACAPKEKLPGGSQSTPEVSSSDVSSTPDLPEPDASAPDSALPDASREEPLTPLTQEDRAAAYDAAMDYYMGTVFEVDTLTEIEVKAGEITFQVSCSKGGAKVDPDRTISLERKNGAWTVVSEGY